MAVRRKATKKRMNVKVSKSRSKVGSNISIPLDGTASKDDIETYKKVLRAAMSIDWGGNCGINECYKCMVCSGVKPCVICAGQKPCLVCHVCVECSCGPCNCMRGIGKKGTKGFETFG